MNKSYSFFISATVRISTHQKERIGDKKIKIPDCSEYNALDCRAVGGREHKKATGPSCKAMVIILLLNAFFFVDDL